MIKKGDSFVVNKSLLGKKKERQTIACPSNTSFSSPCPFSPVSWIPGSSSPGSSRLDPSNPGSSSSVSLSPRSCSPGILFSASGYLKFRPGFFSVHSVSHFQRQAGLSDFCAQCCCHVKRVWTSEGLSAVNLTWTDCCCRRDSGFFQLSSTWLPLLAAEEQKTYIHINLNCFPSLDDSTTVFLQ